MKKKHGANSPIFSSKLMVSLSGRSFCVCLRADALFDLGFGVWILDLFFFGVLECDGKAMNGTETNK